VLSINLIELYSADFIKYFRKGIRKIKSVKFNQKKKLKTKNQFEREEKKTPGVVFLFFSSFFLNVFMVIYGLCRNYY